MQQSSPFNSLFDVDQMSDLIPSNDSNAGESISDPYALQAGDLEYYKNNFGYIDGDHDGYITFVEFANYLTDNGMDSRLADKLFPMCDQDMDGFLDESEFIRAARIASVSLSGLPLPFDIPESLRDLSGTKGESASNADLQSSLNMDLIPSFAPTSTVNTNPFAEGLEEAEEKERQELEALKDPNNVPAIVSDNRDKLVAQWRENMQKWRSTECELREKADEITAKKEENVELRKQIEQLQTSLSDIQEAVEQKLKRISVLQATLNNHLVKNKLSRPVRVTYDQPDLNDLFTPPEDKPDDTAKDLSSQAAAGFDAPLPYDVLEKDESILPPQSSFDIFSAPLPESFRSPSLSREASRVPEEPVANPRAFSRSKKARSFYASETKKEALSDSESSDEDLKPTMQTTFSAFVRGNKRDVNEMGTSRWYRGAYETKHRMEDLIKQEEEERKKQEEERKKIEEEGRRRKREEKKKRKEEEKKVEEEAAFSDASYSEASEKEERKPIVFVMSDSDDVFSDEDLPAEKPVEETVEGPVEGPVEEEKPVEEEEKPAEEEKKEEEKKEEPIPDEEFIDDFAEEEKEEEKKDEKPAEEEKKEEPAPDEEFIDDFAEEKKEDEFIDDFAEEKKKKEEEDLPAEKKEDKKEDKKKKDKKDKKKGKKEAKAAPKTEEKNERRGRRGRRENDKKESTEGALGQLGPAKPKSKKKKTVAK